MRLVRRAKKPLPKLDNPKISCEDRQTCGGGRTCPSTDAARNPVDENDRTPRDLPDTAGTRASAPATLHQDSVSRATHRGAGRLAGVWAPRGDVPRRGPRFIGARDGHEAGSRRPIEQPTTPMIPTASAPVPVAARQIRAASPATSAPTTRQTGLSSLDNTSSQPSPPHWPCMGLQPFVAYGPLSTGQPRSPLQGAPGAEPIGSAQAA